MLKHLSTELRDHLPYSIFSVTLGMILLGILTFIAQISGLTNISGPSKELFHIFHPIHLLFSATATTAMFRRHEKRFFKAIIIGFIGSAGICGISDTFIPYIAGFLLNVEMDLHICIIQHPKLIFPFLISGILIGLIIPDIQKSTLFSHSAHILISSMASLLYLISFGLTEWTHVAGMIFIYIVLAVIIPCCTSDIVFPLLLAKDLSTDF